MRNDNPLRDQFALFAEKVRLVANGIMACTAASGPPGIGKTYHAVRLLTELGVQHQLVRGTTPALLHAAYDLRHGGVMLLDDADDLILGGGSARANLLKALTTPGQSRVIVNTTATAIANAERDEPKVHILPPKFRTKAGLIWLTNIDLSRAKPQQTEHMAALLDRGLKPLSFSFDSTDVVDYIFDLIVEEGILRRAGLKLVEAQDVTDWLAAHCYRVDRLSVRMVLEIAAYRKAKPDMWLRLASTRLRDTPVSDKAPPVAPRIVPPSVRQPRPSPAPTTAALAVDRRRDERRRNLLAAMVSRITREHDIPDEKLVEDAVAQAHGWRNSITWLSKCGERDDLLTDVIRRLKPGRLRDNLEVMATLSKPEVNAQTNP